MEFFSPFRLRNALTGLLVAGALAHSATAQTIIPVVSGHYTINSLGETHGRNFRSFTDLAASLNSATLAGDVVIDVKIHSAPTPLVGGSINDRISNRGAYSEQPIIFKYNPNNQGYHITLDGHGETLMVATEALPENKVAAIQFQSVHNFTLRNLHVVTAVNSTNPIGWGIWLRGARDNKQCENVVIDNCVIDVPSGISGNNSYGIIAKSGFTTGAYSSVANCSFTHNRINGGDRGISISGDSYSKGNLVAENYVTNVGGVGYWFRTVPNLTVSRNTLRSNLTPDRYPYAGIFYQGSNDAPSTSTEVVIDGNDLMQFRSGEAAGISITEAKKVRISNNIVAGFFRVERERDGTECSNSNMLSLACRNSDDMDIIHNTFIMDANVMEDDCLKKNNPDPSLPQSPQIRAVYIRGTAASDDNCVLAQNIRILNNIIAYTGSSNVADWGLMTLSEMVPFAADDFNYNYFYSSHTNLRLFTEVGCRKQGNSNNDFNEHADLNSLKNPNGSPTSVTRETNEHSRFNIDQVNLPSPTLADFNAYFVNAVGTSLGNYHLLQLLPTNQNIIGHKLEKVVSAQPEYQFDIDGNDRDLMGYYTPGADAITSPHLRPAAKAGTQASALPAAAGALQLTLSPNPLEQRTLTVRVVARTAGAATLTLTDALGRVVKTQALTLTAGAQEIPVELKALAKGSYFVRIAQAGESSVQQLLRQ